MVSRDFIFWEVDVQADFMLPGGNLYVPGAEKLLPNIRRLTDAARQGRVFLVSHGCFHTPNDPEFKIFPPHCVKGTSGAAFHPDLKLPPDVDIISKAEDPDKDSYSAFGGTDLAERLHRANIKTVWIGGLGTNFNFLGSVDELAVYSRGLSAAEVPRVGTKDLHRGVRAASLIFFA